MASVRGDGLRSGVGGQQQRAHRLELHRCGVQRRAVVGRQRGGVRGRGRRAGPVDLAGQFREPVGERAIPETDRSVQRDHLHGRLMLRRGHLPRLTGQRDGLADAALGGRHPRATEQQLRFHMGKPRMLCDRTHPQPCIACGGRIAGHRERTVQVNR